MRRFRLIFEVGAADPFLQIEIGRSFAQTQNANPQIADMALSRPMTAERCFVHVHDVEAAGMKLPVAGQLVAYEVSPARDGRSKAVNLRLLTDS